jgi:hypothetical protein
MASQTARENIPKAPPALEGAALSPTSSDIFLCFEAASPMIIDHRGPMVHKFWVCGADEEGSPALESFLNACSTTA